MFDQPYRRLKARIQEAQTPQQIREVRREILELPHDDPDRSSLAEELKMVEIQRDEVVEEV